MSLEGGEQYLQYGEKEMAWLARRDKKLGQVIAKRGIVKRAVHPDPFTALLRTVIGQQISGKAQESIWKRFQNAFFPLTPHNVARADAEAMRACGVSPRKVSYLQDIGREFDAGELGRLDLASLDDAALREKLLKLRGIGPWTVEMLLIFTFQRQNVLSYGDLAIQRGMSMLYGHEKITPEIFGKYYRRYSPYATVAGLYLWEIAGGQVDGFNSARKSGRPPAK